MFWDDARPTVTHVGRLVLDPPAGKRGFVMVEGEGFRFQDGTPVKFWGVNLSAGANFPQHEVAEQVAARLAKLGFNLVRLHHMDSAYEPRGIWDRNFTDTRHISQEQLERLDYLIAQLKSRGIYVDLNLHVGRPFAVADGVVEAALIPRLGKFVTLFDRRLIDLQKEYAKLILTHRNPYTGRVYTDEPAIALVELTNENSLFAGWLSGALDREELASTRPEDPWRGPLPPSYRRELDALWNTWLLDRYRTRQSLEAAWRPQEVGESGLRVEEDPARSTVGRTPWAERERVSAARLADLARFYAWVEAAYFREMISYLRKEVGLKAPITGTNNYYGLPSILAQSAADYMDTHGYWDHPTFPGRPWDRTDFRITNRSLVLTPALMQRSAFNSSPIPRWTLSAVCGRPLTVSEWNQPFPNVYEYEMPLLVAAYGAFQGWDGLFAYTYRHDRENWGRQGITGWFDLDANPVKLALLSIGALLFLREDVSPGRQTVRLVHEEAEVFRSFRQMGGTPSYGPSGLPMTIALEHRVCQMFVPGRPGQPEGESPPMGRDPFTSDTGQLIWDAEVGMVQVDTPRTQGAVGFLSRKPVVLQDVQIRSETDAAIVITSLDGRPLERSRQMLLVAAGGQMNTGQQWRSDGRGLATWGTGPVLLQPVRAAITVSGANRLQVFALDGRGDRLAEVPVVCSGSRCSFSIGSSGAVWFELAR
ncbi:MAG: cellulase family glycosylhydrolase [Armatimonadota bacterium]|nr:cellulase family glycosylhydrolase [Armatimonadota bacterium]